MNFITGKIDENGVFNTKQNDCKVQIPESKLKAVRENNLFNKPITLGIRPEHIYDDADNLAKFSDAVLDIKVDVSELLGASTNVHCTVGGQHLVAVVQPRADLRIGSPLQLSMDLSKCHLFDPETEKCLTAVL
jgi:multiple sugar transport system ATP-binding protein